MASRDSTYRNRIKSAKPHEIAVLERIAGIALPPFYRGYLSAMGHDDAGLELAFAGTTEIDAIFGYYKEIAADESYAPPEGCLVIGTGDFSIGEILLCPWRDGAPRVMFSIDGEVTGLYAESLEKLLFRTGFSLHDLTGRSCVMRYLVSQVEDSKPVLGRVAQTSGFERLWFSDEIVYCASKGDLVIGITQYQGWAAVLTITGDEPNLVNVAVRSFEDTGLLESDLR